MQIYCDFSACIYNEDDFCGKEKIFLDDNGVCTSCAFELEQDEDNEGEQSDC